MRIFYRLIKVVFVSFFACNCIQDLELEAAGQGGQNIRIDGENYDFSGAAVFNDGYSSISDEYHREYILTSTPVLPSTTINDYTYAIMVSAFCTGQTFKYGKFSHSDKGDQYGTIFLIGPGLIKYGTGGSFTINDLGNNKVRLDFDVKSFGSSLFKGSYEGEFIPVDDRFTSVLSSS